VPEPFVDMHAQDALVAGVRVGELARLATRWGSVVARLRTSGEIARGAVFAPIHWSAANSSDARVGALVNPVVDAVSGEPEFKHTPARVEPFRVEWYGVLYQRDDAATPGSPSTVETAPASASAPAPVPDVTWWTRIRGEGFLRYEIAGRNRLFNRSSEARGQRESWARQLLNVRAGDGADFLDYDDTTGGVYRAAYLENDRLVACVFLSSRPELPSREWLTGLLMKNRIADTDRRALLAGRPLTAGADPGALVCSCFRVGRNTIADAIKCHGLKTPAQVGSRLKAGTNCGSCLPEISSLIASSPQ
jgi:assimilatory nitrate reductase catalytic subunit